MAATATAEKQTAATLKIELRGGECIYKLAAKERSKLVKAAALCGELGTIPELVQFTDPAKKALDELVSQFPVDE